MDIGRPSTAVVNAPRSLFEAPLCDPLAEIAELRGVMSVALTGYLLEALATKVGLADFDADRGQVGQLAY